MKNTKNKKSKIQNNKVKKLEKKEALEYIANSSYSLE